MVHEIHVFPPRKLEVNKKNLAKSISWVEVASNKSIYITFGAVPPYICTTIYLLYMSCICDLTRGPFFIAYKIANPVVGVWSCIDPQPHGSHHLPSTLRHLLTCVAVRCTSSSSFNEAVAPPEDFLLQQIERKWLEKGTSSNHVSGTHLSNP